MEIGFALTKLLAILTLSGNLLTIGLCIFFVIRRSIFDGIIEWLGEHALCIGLVISSGATLGSLVYSEVVGYPACILCWIQRVFMYPQLFLFSLALWRKERNIIPYALSLSLLGGAVALYQWVKDMLALYTHVALGCPVVVGLPSCDRMYVLEFGYITIPMIALNAFILLTLVMWAGLRRAKSGE